MKKTYEQLLYDFKKAIKNGNAEIREEIKAEIEALKKVNPKDRPDYDDDIKITKSGFGKTYKEIFNKSYIAGSDFEDYEDFLKAVKVGFDPRLKDLSSGVGSEGGFLLPEGFSEDIINISIEDSIVMPRAKIYGLKNGKGNSLKVPAYQDIDRSTSGLAGVDPAQIAEGGQKTKTDPKFRSISLKVHKTVCYSQSSDEILEESGIPLSDVIGTAFKNAILWKIDYRMLTGTGVGMPLGVLNSPALLTQAAESGQTASTITYNNIVGMFGKLAPGSWKNAIWVSGLSTLPEMMRLSIEVGLGGEHVKLLQESNGQFTLLGKPVLFSEKLPSLGSAGQLLLADFSKYAVLLKEGLKLESSIHEGFRNDLTSWRMILKIDGQPIVEDPLTCLDGTIVSPFVQLGDVA